MCSSGSNGGGVGGRGFACQFENSVRTCLFEDPSPPPPVFEEALDPSLIRATHPSQMTTGSLDLTYEGQRKDDIRDPAVGVQERRAPPPTPPQL